MNENIEIWADIDGYEGLYEISSLGRVRSLDRMVNAAYGSMKLQKGRILKPELNKYGYHQVHLSKDGKVKTHKIYRLVAQAFIPNLQNFKEVNHINECKTDNRASNLEWCTHEYNVNFGTRNERASIAMTNGKLSKRVAQIDKNTNEVIRIWESTNECGRNGYNQGHIAECCRNCYCGSNIYKGYKWQYIKDSI